MSQASVVETGQIRSGVEIPVTCYQLLGVTVKAEKDEIVKAVNELKSSEIEDGYTADTINSRQDLLEVLRDKLLFEPEYAGNLKENIPPKSSLRLPWAWLPAALCLLQEVGEENLVLDIGRAAVQIPESKLYIHDLLLSMALAECSTAKEAFEKNHISKGFEALARAQHLWRSENSLEKMPLLSETRTFGAHVILLRYSMKIKMTLNLGLDRRIFRGACACLHTRAIRHALIVLNVEEGQ